MLILIDGFGGSGKTILRSLLDGHNELFVSPSQECLISCFYRNLDKSQFFAYKDISLLREYLADSYYYNLEKESLIGFTESDLKRKKIKFNFYEFENFWVNELKKKKKWDNKIILEIIYSSVIKFFYNTKNLPINKKKVFLESGNFDCHKFFLDEIKGSKIIVLKRSSADNLVSLLNRETISSNYKTEGYKKYNFNYLVRSQHFPIRINENYKISEKLKKEFPGRIYECEFKNLIYSTESEMKNISKFLDISYEKILLQATHFGENIKFKNGDDVLNKEKYTAKNAFSKYQIELVEQFKKKFLLKDLFSLSFFDFLFIKTFYLAKLFFRKFKIFLI